MSEQVKTDNEKEVEEISFIVITGYYPSDDSDKEDELYPHTPLTYDLYHRGFAACGYLKDEEIYEGICIDDGKPLAQIETGDGVKYIEIPIEEDNHSETD